MEDVRTEAENQDQGPAQPTIRNKAARKPAPTPDVLDLDLTSEPSLASFAAKANPRSDHKRYLVIAAWLKEHRETSVITPDHVYTCYRALKWPTDKSDFAQPLRALKAKQFFTLPQKGQYAINHLGLAEVNKLIMSEGNGT
jgi:hypothetical protein